VFGGRVIGVDLPFNALDAAQKAQIATIAAAFTGLLSLFNIGGRFAWATCSDYIGRKATYFVFLALGFVLYAAIPSLAHGGRLALFVLSFCVILSMYGGGFSTVPAYLADLFGTQMVGAIHGRLLTAWAAAGVMGTSLINTIREYQIAHGVAKAQAYDTVMYVLAALLVLGFLCNLLVRPLADKHFMSDAELADEKRRAHDREAAASKGERAAGAGGVMAGVSGVGVMTAAPARTGTGNALVTLLAWAAVGIPLLAGVWITLQKAIVLFQ
jgi:MFS family permease